VSNLNEVPKELSDSERLKILENQINGKIVEGYNLWAWFLVGGVLLFIPIIGPFLFGIWTIIKIINLVNRKEIRESYGIDKYGKLQRVTF
jgi:hypothetical protein